MRKMIVVFICMLCILSGCGKLETENEQTAETKIYTIPGNVCFSVDDDERTRMFTAGHMSLDKNGLHTFAEDSYLNENGDLVLVMTLEQAEKQKESLYGFIYDYTGAFVKGVLSYNFNDSYTELYMKFPSKEVYESDTNQARMNIILSMMLMWQIYDGKDAADAEVTLNIEYTDTDDIETIVYICEGFVK